MGKVLEGSRMLGQWAQAEEWRQIVCGRKLGLKYNPVKSQPPSLPGRRGCRQAAEPTLDRNQPADFPLLLWPTVIFISCPRSVASTVNLSSPPFSKLFFPPSSLRSPVGTDTHEHYKGDQRSRKNQLHAFTVCLLKGVLRSQLGKEGLEWG